MGAHAGGQPDSTPLRRSNVPRRRLDYDDEGVQEKNADAEVDDRAARDKRVQQPLHPQQANIPADNTRLSGTFSMQAFDVLKGQVAELRREQMEMKGVLPGGRAARTIHPPVHAEPLVINSTPLVPSGPAGVDQERHDVKTTSQVMEIRELNIRLKDAKANESDSNLFGGSVSGTAQLLAKAQERSRRRKRGLEYSPYPQASEPD